MSIDRFTGEHDFLSNFHPSTISVEGNLYRTVEHAYQALKSPDEDVRKTIREAGTPSQAKKLGRCILIRNDWDQVREGVMLDLLRKKFENPFLAEKLLSTGDEELIEGNNWNDTFWGVCRGVGENKLGILLMQVRDEIRSSEES